MAATFLEVAYAAKTKTDAVDENANTCTFDQEAILKQWTREQNRLCQMISVDDNDLGFEIPHYAPTQQSPSSVAKANVKKEKANSLDEVSESNHETSPEESSSTSPVILKHEEQSNENHSSSRRSKNGEKGAKRKTVNAEPAADDIVGASSTKRPTIPSLHSSVRPCVTTLPSLGALSEDTHKKSEQSPSPSNSLKPLKVIAGVDISFVKDTDVAVASLVLMSYPELKVLHTIMRHVTMTEPYIPGFLAFREVPLVSPLIEEARKTLPAAMHPQLLFVDGNGVHHPRRFGFASHLGVVCDIPTIGCAKKLLAVDGLVNSKITEDLEQWTMVDKKGPIMPLISPMSNRLYGYAALTGNSTKNPIYISPGHRISFLTALQMTILVTLFRVPEPIRQADLLSREHIRKNFTTSGELIQPK